MKYIKQLSIILFVSCLGELLAMILPFPIPGAVYGLVLMFTALCTKLIKLSQIEETARFLLDIMVIMFVPPAVGLISKWNVLKPVWPRLLAITIITTFVVMFVTGHVAQLLIRHKKIHDNTREADKPDDEVNAQEVARNE